MTLRATITGAEEARMLDGTGTWVFKVEVKRRTDAAWTDVTNVAGGDWVLAITVDGDSPDKPVGSFTVRLLRAADGSSMAPGVAGSTLNAAQGIFSPLIFPGRMIRVFAGNLAPGQTRAAATWHPWLEGEIDRAGWSDDVIAECSTLDGVIQRASIEAEEVRGAADPGVPLQTEVQGLLTRWLDAPPALLTVGEPDHGVGEYKTPVGSLGEFLLTQAQRIAWDLRYRWDDASASFRYTLYLPPRGKATPDLYLPASQVFDVPELYVDRTNVRNAFTLTYPDKNTGSPETIYDLDPDSRDEFGRAWMGITEPADSSINEQPKGAALLSYARSDLARPPTEKRVRVPFLPFLALHHMVRIGADGKRFDFDQNYSVVGTTHEVTPEGASSVVSLRGGSPVGMYYAWRRRNGGETTGNGTITAEPGNDGLLNFREYTDAGGVTVLAWDGTASLVQEVWASSVVFNLPLPNDPWAVVAAGALPLPAGTLSLAYEQPGEGQRRLIQVETRLAFMEQGQTYRVNQFGTVAPIDWSAVPTETSSDVTLGVRVTDPRDVVSLVRFYTLILGVRSGPFSATVTDGKYYAFSLALDPKHPVGIQPELVRNDGFPPILGETYTADLGKDANITDVRRQRTGNSEVILVDGDTDTDSLWYREDVAGVLGAEIGISPRGSDPRFGAFTIAAGATARKFRIYGKNDLLEVGEYVDWRVEPFSAAPALDVVASPGTVSYSLSWSGDSVTLSTGGAFAAPPASPIVVARGAAGTAPQEYTFRAVRDGIAVTNSVTIPPLGADTVSPDLVVVPGTADNSTANFTASASNPRTGGAVSVVVTLAGCTATVSGVAFVSGNTLAAGAVLVVVRPAFGLAAGTVTFTATVASAGEVYGGSERIQRTVPSVQRDTVGLTARAIVSPATNPSPGTQVIIRFAVSDPFPSATVSAAYSASGVGTITPASPQTVPSITNDINSTGYVDFTIPRPAAGSAVGRVVFTASATGRTQGVDSVDISPQAVTIPPTQPVLDALWLSVVNHPANPGPGYVDVFDLAWDVSTAVNDTDHRVDVTFYTAGVAVNTQSGLLPSVGGAGYVKTGVGSTVRQHTATVTLRTTTGGGTLGYLESAPVSTTIDATPYP